MCVLVCVCGGGCSGEGGVEGKRVCACLHVCVEQRIGWGLGVRVCADVRAYNMCMRQSERVHACVFEKVRGVR